MVLICWSAWIFSELFFVGLEIVLRVVVPNYFLLQEGVTERRELVLIACCSDKLASLPISPLQWSGILIHFSGLLWCISQDPGSLCHSHRDPHLAAADSGSRQNSTRQCSKVLENSGSPGCRSVLGVLGSIVQMP